MFPKELFEHSKTSKALNRQIVNKETVITFLNKCLQKIGIGSKHLNSSQHEDRNKPDISLFESLLQTTNWI